MKYQEAFDLLNEQLKDIPKAQIRSMSLSVLPRLMDVLDHNHTKCPYCQKMSKDGSRYVHNIRPLFEQDMSINKHFEQWVESSQKHLKTEHNQYVKGRITSAYATYGMTIGTLIAFAYIYITGGETSIGGISIGWTCGMLIGYLSGKIKEQRLAKNNQLY